MTYSSMTPPACSIPPIPASPHPPVTPDGIIHTVAGTGVNRLTGDGGQATQARLKNPKTVLVFGGWLYTAGLDNKVGRVNLDTGIIETYAGTGLAGFQRYLCQAQSPARATPGRFRSATSTSLSPSIPHPTDRRFEMSDDDGRRAGVARLGSVSGSATSSALNSPRGIVLDSDTVWFIADSSNHLIRRLDSSLVSNGRSRAGRGVCRRRGARRTGEVSTNLRD